MTADVVRAYCADRGEHEWARLEDPADGRLARKLRSFSYVGFLGDLDREAE